VDAATSLRDDLVIDDVEPATGRLPVSFFLAERIDIRAVSSLDPDRDLGYFRRGEWSWVVQTFLRLRAAGYPVELTNTAPERGIVVFHAKHKRALARAARGRSELVFVAIRADNSSPLLADFEVLQNGRFADGRIRFAVPFWPQPGIRLRDQQRRNRVERVGYLGLEENLHPDFRSAAWSRTLADLGIEWVTRMTRYRDVGSLSLVHWVDYRDLDVILAVRPVESHLKFAKPANKLINAWRAGVPALIGADYACREIRRSPEDYLEVRGAADAVTALRRLRDDPDLFTRMVANGRRRAEDFTFNAITSRWAELLFDTLPRQIATGALPWSHRLPIPLRLPLRRAARIVSAARSR
jgi:hypothetical protein